MGSSTSSNEKPFDQEVYFFVFRAMKNQLFLFQVVIIVRELSWVKDIQFVNQSGY